jgi:hypothetical protein
MYWSSFDWTTYRLVIAPVSFIKGEGSLLAGSLFMNLFEFLTTRFANWMNKSNSDFNSLWIDRICYNVHLHEIVKSRKTAKKSLPTFPTYGGSVQLLDIIFPTVGCDELVWNSMGHDRNDQVIVEIPVNTILEVFNLCDHLVKLKI